MFMYELADDAVMSIAAIDKFLASCNGELRATPFSSPFSTSQLRPHYYPATKGSISVGSTGPYTILDRQSSHILDPLLSRSTPSMPSTEHLPTYLPFCANSTS